MNKILKDCEIYYPVMVWIVEKSCIYKVGLLKWGCIEICEVNCKGWKRKEAYYARECI